jgi:hypothetical protein
MESKMRIMKVSVTYGELRSAGYPSFSNKRYELTLEAEVQQGESPREVKEKLTDLANKEVRKYFGDNIEQTELDLRIE